LNDMIAESEIEPYKDLFSTTHCVLNKDTVLYISN